MLKRLLGLGILFTLALYSWDQRREIAQPDGPIAPAAPRQTDMRDAPSHDLKGYRMTPLARISLEARVLGHERYYFDRPSDLSPIDLALGWGPMSANQVLERMKIYQSGRYYFWQAPRLPIPGREISRHSANMHMIPSSNQIARALKRVRSGQVVQLSGYLVKIEAPDGWQWRSSLSRKDTGNGSCEVIYVKDFRIRDS